MPTNKIETSELNFSALNVFGTGSYNRIE